MTDTDTAIVLTDAQLALVEDLRSTREDIKKLKAKEDGIRAALLDELQGVEYGVTASGAPLIEVERYSRTRVDSKRLQALYEDVWKDCQTETSVEVLRLSEIDTV